MSKLAVVMCTKNGEKFVEEQLESIKNQTFKNFDIFISDNNSEDSTLKKINKFKEKNHEMRINIEDGKDLFFGNNFIDLLQRIEDKYDYYAFCDQDDIWLDFHLARGVKNLKNKENIPSIVCSRTYLIDENGNNIGASKKFKKNPNFRNALVQSIAGGNTMIFNNSAKKLMNNVSIDIEIVSHDWLLYLFISAASGNVIYSIDPSVMYRQHLNNAIGSNNTFYDLLKRVRMLIAGDFKKYNDLNILQLDNFRYISKKNIKTYYLYKKSLEGSFFMKVVYKIRSKVYRQSILGQLGLYFDIILKKKELNEKT
tara:strand:+ start:254 stop:1186 length:933 start_codon:yes stop_codon:yes gene_type:complete